jgi:hypothetical protein
MLDLDSYDLEHSSLSGPFTRDGVTVEIEIFRIAGTQDLWQLEVIDPNGRPTAWHQQFTTEQEAFEAFAAMMEADGIASFGNQQLKRHQA